MLHLSRADTDVFKVDGSNMETESFSVHSDMTKWAQYNSCLYPTKNSHKCWPSLFLLKVQILLPFQWLMGGKLAISLCQWLEHRCQYCAKYPQVISHWPALCTAVLTLDTVKDCYWSGDFQLLFFSHNECWRLGLSFTRTLHFIGKLTWFPGD